MGFAEIVVRESAFAALAALVTAAMRIVYDRLRVRSATPMVITATGLGVSFAGALAWTLAYYGYLHSVAPALLSALYGVPVPPLRQGMVLDGTVFHWSILLGWSALYIGLHYYTELQEERVRALRAEAHAHQARLQALRYQLNPHFLFNALNGVSTLVTERHTREATDMLAQLSDFLRLTLEANDAAEVTLAHEVDFARRYLDIEQARFGDRLRVRFDVAPDVLAAAVPALVLQPLVENAVKYAVASREGGGGLSVEAHADENDLVLAVQDDGPGLSDGCANGLGVGLANVRARLREQYGEGAALGFEEAAGGGLRAVIRLPLRLPAAA
jgi:LytS/YehU family sensor histidine kinase